MNIKTLHRIFAAAVFLISAITYFATVQPSVSFWDCGEFIASSYLMQVPHPPGTPFFLILGRLFSLIPFAENIAFRVNTVSVLSSAFTAMFLYLIAKMLIENYRGIDYKKKSEAVLTYIASAVGALSLTFSDTFWFNAVEAEVYALATFFIAFVVWLMIVWHSRADEKDNEKYLLMIAYLIGLSTGVHLMSVLAIVPIVMVIAFRKYMTEEETLKRTALIFIIHSAIILLAALALWGSETDAFAPSSEAYQAFDQKAVMIFVAISALFMGIMWKKIFQRNSFYIPIIVGGVALIATYPGMVKYIPNLIATIGKNNIVVDIFIFLAIFGLVGYLIYWSNREKKETLHLVGKLILFALIGFTTYSSIIIRSNQDTPINLNSPKTFSELVSYLNREQYGDFPTFKRRYSQEAHQQQIYTNYSSDLDFFWNYQMNHMFNRYLFWNYIGRNSTVQDSGVNLGQLFAIPFLVGLFGLYYHFRRDWKMASVFLVMFIFLGWLTAFYQNQQQPQPRERDYFYVGAFFVYSIWIALGARGIFDLIQEQFKETNINKILSGAAATALILLIPVNMVATNWYEHNRANNYVPWDYSYNLLQSVAPNAILFTNGDNDTFPLWYLQDVEGVRQDVRIANLSLLNTPWYVKQLKNTAPHDSEPVAMTLRDTEVDEISPQRWDAQKISFPINQQTIEQFNITDSTIINSGRFEWVMQPTGQFGDISIVRAQDIAVLSMILANKFDRPIYFAVTCADDARISLDDHMQMEGLAYRFVPQKREGVEFVNPEILETQIFEEPEGFSKEYQPGFKFRGLKDSTIFFDDNHRRLVQNYRNSFMRLALNYLYDNPDYGKVVEVLDVMEEKLPRKIIPIDNRLLHDIANIYYSAGAIEKSIEIGYEIEQYALKRLEDNARDFSGRYSPYVMLMEIYENRGDYNAAIEILRKLQEFAPNDQSVKTRIEQLRSMAESQKPEVVPEKIPTDSLND